VEHMDCSENLCLTMTAEPAVAKMDCSLCLVVAVEVVAVVVVEAAVVGYAK